MSVNESRKVESPIKITPAATEPAGTLPAAEIASNPVVKSTVVKSTDRYREGQKRPSNLFDVRRGLSKSVLTGNPLGLNLAEVEGEISPYDPMTQGALSDKVFEHPSGTPLTREEVGTLFHYLSSR